MHRFVSLAALMVAISAPAYAFEIKGNVGIGQLQSASQGVSTSGGIGAIVGVGHQDAASAGTAGARRTSNDAGTRTTQATMAITSWAVRQS